MRQTLTTACPLDCPDMCSLEVTVDDGRIVAVDADRSAAANPFTQGYICHKVKHHARRVYAPERVMAPLIRTGAKGVGEFREASWDEALALIGRRMREAVDAGGVDSVIPYLYSSSAGVCASDGLTPLLFEQIGCPEISHTICAATVGAAWRQVYGSMLSADPMDIEHARLLVVWGANPNASNTHLVPLITKAVTAGAQLVTIDPRRTPIAARSHLHLPIRPGTDVVLAYALTRWLVDHDAHDASFLAAHVDGAEAFIAAAQEWTIERAAQVCGVDASSIEALATLLASTSPAMLRLGWGLERNRNGGSGCVAAISLWSVIGAFGVRGSGIVKSTSGAAPVDVGRLRRASPPARSVISMNDVGLALNGELDATPITRVLFVQGANPMSTAMDQHAFERGLRREDLFTVVHEQVMTDTARYADVVLPATSHFEAADLARSYGSFAVAEIRPVIDRVGASRSNDELAAALAAVLADGFDLDVDDFAATPASMIRRIRTDGAGDASGVTQVRAPGSTVQFVDTWPAWAASPDRAPRARLFDAAGALPLPRYEPAAGDGLTMLTPANNRTINSMFAEFDPPDAVITLSPADALARGIVDGARVRVTNDLAQLEVDARVDAGMRDGVVSMPKGLWLKHIDGRQTPNALIPRAVNDLADGACFNDAQVQITPV